MSGAWKPMQTDGGVVIQSGMNMTTRDDVFRGATSIRGPYRGLVVATYVSDEEPSTGRSVVECDVVLVHSQAKLGRVPVMQRGYGLNDTGPLWVPKAATRTVSGDDLNLALVWDAKGTYDRPPTALDDTDGDMVLVDFIEKNKNYPIIIGALPHERSLRSVVDGNGWAEGNNGSERGTAQKFEAYSRHAGTETRINASGDYLLDTVGATSDTEDETPGAGGQVRIRVKGSKRFTVELDGTDVFEVYEDGGGGRIDLIEGAAQAFIRGNSYTSAEAAFLSALSVVMTAVSAFALAMDPGPGPSAAPLITAITTFQTALASFSPPSHLSTRVKGE